MTGGLRTPAAAGVPDQEEIDQRVAILTRLREALLKQREKLGRYLLVLEHQEQDIVHEDVEKLQQHVELEQSIVRELCAMQRVIDPLRDMYRVAQPDGDDQIPEISRSLETLSERVKLRNKHNRELLREHMGELRKKIVDIRNGRPVRSVYAEQTAPSMVDIRT